MKHKTEQSEAQDRTRGSKWTEETYKYNNNTYVRTYIHITNGQKKHAYKYNNNTYVRTYIHITDHGVANRLVRRKWGKATREAEGEGGSNSQAEETGE